MEIFPIHLFILKDYIYFATILSVMLNMHNSCFVQYWSLKPPLPHIHTHMHSFSTTSAVNFFINYPATAQQQSNEGSVTVFGINIYFLGHSKPAAKNFSANALIFWSDCIYVTIKAGVCTNEEERQCSEHKTPLAEHTRAFTYQEGDISFRSITLAALLLLLYCR